ncbi:type II toxin-antitoxin system YafQ family toxin [Candidatus Saccharibacteria bacterium]|nr:type II toxin-antitoxin system YafQ family toxin [Candidatus Saccharibacteria bacterium]
MYDLRMTSRYSKSYKKMRKRGLDMSLLDNVVDLLRCGEMLPAKYKDHALTGKYKGFRECHIKPDWLLIYAINEEILILVLSDTGTHADLFGM